MRINKTIASTLKKALIKIITSDEKTGTFYNEKDWKKACQEKGAVEFKSLFDGKTSAYDKDGKFIGRWNRRSGYVVQVVENS